MRYYNKSDILGKPNLKTFDINSFLTRMGEDTNFQILMTQV